MSKIRLTKEEADRIAGIKGNVNGSILKCYYKFILDKKGEDGIEKVEKRLAELGHPITFNEAFSFKWYPKAYSSLICLVFMEVYNEDEDRAYEIGYAAPIYSILTRLFMKYISVETLLNKASEYWRKHFDFGELKCTEYDLAKHQAILQLDRFKKFHPAVYTYIRGYLARLIEIATQSKNVKIEQTKSLYNNSYDQFKVRW